MLSQPLHGISRRTVVLAGVIFGLLTLPAAAAPAPTVTAIGDLQAPATAIAAGPDGALWHTSDGRTPRIGRTSVAGRTDEVSLDDKRAVPGTIVLGPGEQMWFVDANGSVMRTTAAGSLMTVARVKGAPRSLAVGGDGNLWLAVAGKGTGTGTGTGGGAIGRLTPAGDLTLFDAGLSGDPHDIAAGPDGALWFTERAGDRVGRITLDGSITEFAAPGGPNAIAVGSDGAMWFTRSENAIGRIDASGVVTTFGAGLPPRSRLGDITPGLDGALWFTRSKGIGRITTMGAISFLKTPGLRPGSLAFGGDGALWFTDLKQATLGRIGAPAAKVPAPVLGRTFVARVTRGTVRVSLPGTGTFATLAAATTLPFGTIVDATDGRLRVRSALPGSEGTQTGTFYGGRFQVRQPRRAGGVVRIALRGRLECGAGRSIASTSRTRKRRRRRVWGIDLGGLFRTLGFDSVTTVRGTHWLTEDRCSGTFTRVVKGSVVVRVRRTGKRVVLHAGDSYLARRGP